MATDAGRPHTPFVARNRGGKYRLRVQVDHLYDFEETAAILAYELPDGTDRFGRNTVQRVLKRATARGVSPERAKNEADTDMIAFYRTQLAETGVFPDATDNES